jgi:acyl carrier protein
MQEEEIRGKLKIIFKNVFGENVELLEATTANDIKKWDSLNHTILIKKIEEEFRMEFDLFEMIELKTVGDIINYIKSKIA